MNSIEDIRNTLILALKTEMLVQSLNQQQLADLCGVSRQYISGVLKGTSTLDKLISIMSYVGINVDVIIEGNDGNKS